jgi:predicted transglutaminase-like cysteine proteinase
MRYRLNLALCAFVLGSAATPALAQGPAHGFVPMGDVVDAPFGYSEMCETAPALCQSFASSAQAAPAPMLANAAGTLLTQPTAALAEGTLDQAATPLLAQNDEPALMAALYRVNLRVNRVVAQKTDMTVYGREEMWRPSGTGPRAAGDCEDLALEKRVELLSQNFPADRLFMGIVYSRASGVHAVLVARMAQGDLVLDNRTNTITPWDATGYRWLSIQTPGAPAEWHLAG